MMMVIVMMGMVNWVRMAMLQFLRASIWSGVPRVPRVLSSLSPSLSRIGVSSTLILGE